MAVYKHPNNGKWYCRGRINGERYNKPCSGAKSEKEAKAVEDGIRYKIRLQQSGLEQRKEKDYSFSFLMQKYVEVCSAKNKSSRIAKIQAKYLIEYFGKNKSIKTIKPSDIEKFKLYMINKGKSKATVNRYLSAIKRAYNILIIDELINYNPANKVKKFDEDNRRYRYLSKLEWNKLKKFLSDDILNIVIVALQTGLRKGNVLNLMWEQIDFKLRRIEILKSENKGKKYLIIPINDSLYELLTSLNPKDNGYVFINSETGEPYKDIRKSFNTALEKAGIKDFHFHDLRRTVGTWLLEKGVDIRTIQSLYGHSDISTTERYLVATPEQNIKAMNILNNMI